MALQSHMKTAEVSPSTPTTGGAAASARHFPTLVSLYKLRSIAKDPQLDYGGAKHAHDSSRGPPPAPCAPMIYCPTLTLLLLPSSQSPRVDRGVKVICTRHRWSDNLSAAFGEFLWIEGSWGAEQRPSSPDTRSHAPSALHPSVHAPPQTQLQIYTQQFSS